MKSLPKELDLLFHTAFPVQLTPAWLSNEINTGGHWWGGREESVCCSEVITKLLVTLTVVRDLVLDYRVRGGFQKSIRISTMQECSFPGVFANASS